jgi:Fe-S-cluster containining protein
MPDQERTIFPQIPFDIFDEFHASFNGDTPEVCHKCRGGCEDVKVVTLYPGESRYLAHKLNVDYDQFLRKRIDIVKTPYGFTEILRVKVGGCDFLTGDGCDLPPEIRPVACVVYPLVHTHRHGAVDYTLDTWCPMVKHLDDALAPFTVRGYAAARKLGPSSDWAKSLDTYCMPRIHRGRMVQLRTGSDGPHAYDWTDFHRCAVTMAPQPHLVNPDE